MILNYLKFLNNRKAWIAILLISDLLAAFVAFISSLSLRGSGLLNQYVGTINLSEVYNQAFLFSIAVFVITFFLYGLYEFKNLKRLHEMLLLSKASFAWIIFLMASAYLYKYDFSRLILIIFGVLCFLYVFIGRQLLQLLRNYLLRYNIGHVQVIVVGKGKFAREVKNALDEYYGNGMRILGIIEPLQKEGKYTLAYDELNNLIKGGKNIEVYIAEPQFSHEHILEIATYFSSTSIQFKIVADIFTLATGSFKPNDIDEIPLLDFQRSKPSLLFKFTKRGIDFFGAMFLFIITSPLWLVISLIIKMDSEGPVLILQRRVGYQGKPFFIKKFRTMYTTTNLYEKSPTGLKDPRITRFGNFLRRTSLDELPQLLNVIMGSMSLVGPRPEMDFIVAQYSNWQRKRLDAKPGITGLWQILGRKDLPLVENLHYDFYYINNQSLLLDFVILLKTIPAVFFGRGAY